jgi:hypothetical protein
MGPAVPKTEQSNAFPYTYISCCTAFDALFQVLLFRKQNKTVLQAGSATDLGQALRPYCREKSQYPRAGRRTAFAGALN